MGLLEQAFPLPEPSADEDDQTPQVPARRVLEPEYFLEQDDHLQRLLAGCHTLRALVEKAETQLELSHDEAQVLASTVGHLHTGPQAVNAILRKCPDTAESPLIGKRQRGNPMSCAKIRNKTPAPTMRGWKL